MKPSISSSPHMEIGCSAFNKGCVMLPTLISNLIRDPERNSQIAQMQAIIEWKSVRLDCIRAILNY
jgi:hypothetical protein